MKRILVNNFCFIALCIIAVTGCEKKFGEGVSLKDIEVEPTVKVAIDNTITRAKAYPVPWDCTDYKFTYTSSNPAVVEVDEWGRLTPHDFGTCTITVSSGSISKTISVEVYDPPMKDRLEALGVKYYYDFEDAGNLFKAIIGNKDLVPVLADGYSFEQVEGFNSTKKALRKPDGIQNSDGYCINHLFLDHGFAANGGGVYVNQFTIMMDVKLPANPSPGYNLGGDFAIFHTPVNDITKLPYGEDPGCIFQNGGGFGINGATTAGGVLEREEWYRIVICADLGISIKNWKDGNLLTASSVGSIDWKHRAWELNGVVIFGDSGRRRNVKGFDVANLAIWDRCLSDREVATLGILRK